MKSKAARAKSRKLTRRSFFSQREPQLQKAQEAFRAENLHVNKSIKQMPQVFTDIKSDIELN